jgi:hypothetical protein
VVATYRDHDHPVIRRIGKTKHQEGHQGHSAESVELAGYNIDRNKVRRNDNTDLVEWGEKSGYVCYLVKWRDEGYKRAG